MCKHRLVTGVDFRHHTVVEDIPVMWALDTGEPGKVGHDMIKLHALPKSETLRCS